MSDQSSIQWTDATWNPTTGCTKIAPECANCYIANTPPFRMAGRKFVHGKIPLEFHEDRLDTPLHWRKPRRVFVNSLSDIFHEDIADEFIRKVFAVMAEAEQHTFQVLTKRAERMRSFVRGLEREGDFAALSGDVKAWPIPNLWLGTSVGVRKRKDQIDLLRQTPAAVRFLSLEPLLEDLGTLDLTGIHWVICGGESGPGARPCNVAWVRSIVDQCREAKVPVFVKQLGSKPYSNGDKITHRGANFKELMPERGDRAAVWFRYLNDRKGGDIEEFPSDLQVREFPATA